MTLGDFPDVSREAITLHGNVEHLTNQCPGQQNSIGLLNPFR